MSKRILMLVAVDVDPAHWARLNAHRMDRLGRAATTPEHDVDCAVAQALQHLDGVERVRVTVVPE